MLYKGVTPADSVIGRQLYFAGVFAVMIAFGIVEQLMLCKRSVTKKQTGDGGEETEQKKLNWRSK